jgi:uncharacterized damage-inducible protein DinB
MGKPSGGRSADAVFDDLEAEHDGLDTILSGLSDQAWLTESGAAGWTIADVVLHLAQTEEAVTATAHHDADAIEWRDLAPTVDEAMAAMLRAGSASIVGRPRS